MSSTGTSLRFPQLGHRALRLPLGSRSDKELIVLTVIGDHQLFVSFLPNEDLPLSRSDTRDLVRRPKGFPQIDLREAFRTSYKVSRVGTRKREIFVRKKGHKKLVVAYDSEYDELLVRTGSEG